MRKIVPAALSAFVALSLFAQSPAMKPFELNMDRVRVSNFGGRFSDGKVVVIPSYYVLVSVEGSVWSKNKGAQAHGKYFVSGMEKALMQDVSKKLQDDLVTKMRAKGVSVLAWDDIKGDPDVAGITTDKIDDRYNLPSTGGLGKPVTFVVAAPSDAQMFSKPIQGYVWNFKGLAKAKDAMVVVPEITFTVPQMYGQTQSNYDYDSAGIKMDPTMIFEGAAVTGINAKGGMPAIQVQQHGKRFAADAPGRIRKVGEDKNEVHNAAMAWSTGSYVMELDPVAFTDGLLRVGFAVNDMIVAEAMKGRK